MDELTVYSFNETLNRMRMDELLLRIITWINLTDKFWKKQDRKYIWVIPFIYNSEKDKKN